MITIEINDFPVINNLEHISTDYEIYTDTLLNNLVDFNYNDTVNLLKYTSNIIPNDVVNLKYYARVRRKLSDGTLLPWTPLKEITLSNNNESVILEKDIAVIKPIMNIDTVKLLDVNQNSFTVTVSPYTAIGDNHMSTDWVFTDIDDIVVFSSINDTVNMEAITIDKSVIGLSNLSGLKVYASYNSGLGKSSGWSMTSIEFIKKNYILTSPLTTIDPTVDYNGSISPVNGSLNTNISRIELITNANIIYSIDTKINVKNFLIPASVLTNSTTYDLVFYVLQKGKLHKVVEKLTTI